MFHITCPSVLLSCDKRPSFFLQNGRLDLCVNNAYSAGEMLFTETIERPFWEAPPDDDPAAAWDACNNVGLRNHYLCTVYASRFVSGKILVNFEFIN